MATAPAPAAVAAPMCSRRSASRSRGMRVARAAAWVRSAWRSASRRISTRRCGIALPSAPDFGLEPCTLADLRADGPEQSAAVIRAVLAGREGAPRRIVVANAAAALVVSERVQTVAEGVREAADALDSGRAGQVLERLVACS